MGLLPSLQDSAGCLRTHFDSGFDSLRLELVNRLPADVWMQISDAGVSLQSTMDAEFCRVRDSVASVRARATGLVDAFLREYPEHREALRERDPILFCLLVAGISYLAVQQSIAAVVFVWKWATLSAKCTLLPARWFLMLPRACCCCSRSNRVKSRQKIGAQHHRSPSTPKHPEADSVIPCSETRAE